MDEDSSALEPRSQPRTDRTAWITEGNLPRAVWRLAMPMTATMLLQSLFSLVDMFFVGRLGPAAIAAVGISGMLMGVVHMLAVGITTGCTAFVASAVGRGARGGAERAAAQSLIMGLLLSAAVAAAGIPLAGTLLRLMGTDDAVIDAGRPYLQIMSGGSAMMILFFVFSSAMRGAGDARTPLVVMAVANAINIGLDPLLIFGMYGLPRLGVAGSAWATVAARAAGTAVLVVIFFFRGHEHFHLRPADLRPDWRMIWRLLRVGIFGSGQMLVRNVSGLLLMGIVTRFGTEAVAAYTVGLRLWFMVLLAGMGFGGAAATVVGQNLGAGRPRRAVQAGWLAAGMYAAVCAVVSAGYLAFSGELIRVFNADPKVVALGTSFLRWVAPTLVFVGFSVVLGNAMNGAGDTLLPLVVVVVAVLALRVPLALWLSTAWDSAVGVWAALAVSTVVQGWLHAGAFAWGRWISVGQARVGGPTAAAESQRERSE